MLIYYRKRVKNEYPKRMLGWIPQIMMQQLQKPSQLVNN